MNVYIYALVIISITSRERNQKNEAKKKKAFFVHYQNDDDGNERERYLFFFSNKSPPFMSFPSAFSFFSFFFHMYIFYPTIDAITTTIIHLTNKECFFLWSVDESTTEGIHVRAKKKRTSLRKEKE